MQSFNGASLAWSRQPLTTQPLKFSFLTRLNCNSSYVSGVMDGSSFYKCVEGLVGPENAALYAKKFEPLDGVFFGNLLNYEGLAFYIYSTALTWHQKINQALWERTVDQNVLTFRDALNGALAKEPKLSGNHATVYRGYTVKNPRWFFKNYKTGQEITFHGFTSASTDLSGAYRGNVLFEIRSISAVSITLYSANFEEREALIPAGARFRVLGKSVRVDHMIILLQELKAP